MIRDLNIQLNYTVKLKDLQVIVKENRIHLAVDFLSRQVYCIW